MSFLSNILSGVTGFLSGGVGTALTSLAGSAITSSASRKAANRATDYTRLRDRALEAGFDPLTVLQNGGTNALAASAGQIFQGGQAMGDFVADLPNTIYEQAAQEKDLELQALQADLMQAEIDTYNEMSKTPYGQTFGFGDQPRVALSSGNRDADNQYTGGADANGVPPGSNLRLAGRTVRLDPAYSDTEEYERRYGDVGGALIGLGIMGADYKYNVIDPIIFGQKAKKDAGEQWRFKNRDQQAMADPRFDAFKEWRFSTHYNQ
jgi:hypothetical protein